MPDRRCKRHVHRHCSLRVPNLPIWVFVTNASHPCTFSRHLLCFLLWVNGHASGAPPIQLLSRRRHRLGANRAKEKKNPQPMPRSNRRACSYCSAIALVESEAHAEKVSNKKGQDAALACSPRTHHTHTEKKNLQVARKATAQKKTKRNPYQAGAPLSRSRISVADHKRPPGTFARGIGL